MKNHPIDPRDCQFFIIYYDSRIILSDKTYAQYNIIYFEKYLYFWKFKFQLLESTFLYIFIFSRFPHIFLVFLVQKIFYKD